MFHLLSFHDWRWWTTYGPLLGIATLAALDRPTWPVFAFLVLADLVCVGRNLFLLPNHILFSWVVNLTLLTTLVVTLVRRTSRTAIAAEWMRAFAPWLRIELGLLYFFTVFHKLNTAYFNPEVSCAVSMLHEVAARFPFLPTSAAAEYGVIYGTLLVEVLIPVLLAVPGTRLLGFLLGFAFHALLATHSYIGIYSFSATLFALFAVFLPESLATRLQAPLWLRRVLTTMAGAGVLLLTVWLLRHRLFSGGALEPFLPAPLFKIGMQAALVYALAAFCTIGWLGLRHPAEFRQSAPGTARGLWPLAAFPMLLVLIGLQPYLGLRTLMCFSMFSNLQTEGGRSNHLLMPNWLQVTDWQRDLVEIVESSEPILSALAQQRLTLPFLELRRIRTITPDPMTIVFRRQGQSFEFATADATTHGSIPPLGPLAKHYFRFRPVESDPDQVRCRW